jgi:hypothetical protein
MLVALLLWRGQAVADADGASEMEGGALSLDGECTPLSGLACSRSVRAGRGDRHHALLLDPHLHDLPFLRSSLLICLAVFLDLPLPPLPSPSVHQPPRHRQPPTTAAQTCTHLSAHG